MSAILTDEELQPFVGAVMPLPARRAWWQKCTAWQHMVLDPEIDAYVSGDRHPSDEGCGIYMLFDAGDGLRYVGKAGDVEVAHIYALRPPQNRLYETPRWKQHDAMVALIQESWRPNKCRT